MKNIAIVGFMGTGKTSVAKALAKELGKEYVNIDELVEKMEKRPIKDIFKDSGEAYFRKVEKEAVKKVSQKTDQVIDAGGGVVLDEENMAVLKKTGLVICLWADPEAIWQRTKDHDHRPLLNVTDPKKRIKELLDYRRPFYEKADYHVDSTDGNVAVIVDKIKGIIYEEDSNA